MIRYKHSGFNLNEPRREKTGFLHMRKQRRRSAVTAKLISAFVFATRIVQSLSFLNTKFQASSNFLRRRSLICVGPGRKPRRPVFWRRGSNVMHNLNTMSINLITLDNCANLFNYTSVGRAVRLNDGANFKVIYFNLVGYFSFITLSFGIQLLNILVLPHVFLTCWMTNHRCLGPEVIKLFSCSTQLRSKFILLINV